jgi:hypothetical protein
VAHCKDLVVKIPKEARICQVRYYRSNSEGRRYREQTGLRNSGRSRDHEWAKKGTTKTRINGPNREFRVRCKNWRRSYDRYFGMEIDYQPR